jgi:hypothetical protein
MKTAIKVLGLLLMTAMMLYNVSISKSMKGGNLQLAYVKNSAQAQTENPTTYLNSITNNYTMTTTVVNKDNTTCTQTTSYATVQCSGTGPLSCTNSTVITAGPTYSGNCSGH